MCVYNIHIFIYLYIGIRNVCMQQEARYTPVDTGQHRRKSSSGVPASTMRALIAFIFRISI